MTFRFSRLGVLILALACGSVEPWAPPEDAGSSTEELPTSQVALAAAEEAPGARADEAFRTSVVAYGAEASAFPEALEDFLARHRPGEVLIEIGAALRAVEEAPQGTYDAQVATLMAPTLSLVEDIVAAGGRVQLMVHCATPRWLATYPWGHSVLSGRDEPNGEPVWACSAPTRLESWRELVRATATSFGRFGDRVSFVFGNEPDNYFVGGLETLLDWYEASARGVLDAGLAPRTRVGGVTPVGLESAALTKAYPSLEDDGTVSFRAQRLDAPITKSLVERTAAAALPLDDVTLHAFGWSPVPAETARWQRARATLSGWLSTVGRAPASVRLVLTDFPQWAPYGSNDTEYMAAHVASARMAVAAHGEATGEPVAVLQGFLWPWGFRPTGEAPAGFNGVPALATERGVRKAHDNANLLLDRLEGRLVAVAVDDPFLHAVAAEDGGELRIALALFVPLEYQVDLLFDHYVQMPVMSSDFAGVSLAEEGYDLRTLLGDVALVLYGGQAPAPELLFDDLFGASPRIWAESLPWPAPVRRWFDEAQTFGQRARLRRLGSTPVEITLGGRATGERRLRHYVVDAEHANPHPHREAIDARLHAAVERDELRTELVRIDEEYGVEAGILRDGVVDLGGAPGTLRLSMTPNSVHLLVIEPGVR